MTQAYRSSVGLQVLAQTLEVDLLLAAAQRRLVQLEVVVAD